MIFVSIVSYRDPDVLNTVDDLFDKADKPDQLRVVVFDQCLPTEKLDGIINPRCEYIWTNSQESQGLCWARSEAQKRYKDEEYYLQLDSHHRFVPHWDSKLIDLLRIAESPKPVLTTYGNRLTDEPIDYNEPPNIIVPSHFTQYGTIMLRPEKIETEDLLIPAMFCSGHFLFTSGPDFMRDYKYDPNLYFAGDELSLTLRLYTNGYDIFHPGITILWHEYTRKSRIKHWEDHKLWYIKDRESKKRIRQLTRVEDNKIDLGIYDLGTERTIEDYEKLTGIIYKDHSISSIKNDETRTLILRREFYKNVLEKAHFSTKVEVTRQQIPKLDDNCICWYVSAINEHGMSVYDFGVPRDQIEIPITFKIDFTTISKPVAIRITACYDTGEQKVLIEKPCSFDKYLLNEQSAV